MRLRSPDTAPPRIRAELAGMRALAHDGVRLRLHRVWPERDGRLALEYRNGRGGVVAAQWAPRGDSLQWLAQRTPGGVLAGAGSTRVLLQPGGADRRLAALAGLVAAPGVRLVRHRAELRAVVQTTEALDSTYATVVASGDAAWVAGSARIAGGLAAGAFEVPAPAWADVERGVVAFPGLDGTTLRARLADAAPDRARAVAAAARALRALHDAPPPSGLPVRGAVAQLGRLDAAVERLMPHARGLAYLVAAAVPPAAARLPAFSARGGVPVHGDFHDGRVVDDGDAVGLLSWEELGLGDRALDLASFAVHLELSALERRCSPLVAAAGLRAFCEAYAVGSGLAAEVAAYADVLRLRLACEHALRPGGTQVACMLLRRVGRPA